MFRLPWWVREYIKKNVPITPQTAAQRKLYLSVVYAFCAMMAFNCAVYNSKTPGLTEEEEKLMPEREKILLRMNAPQSTKVIRYKLGQGVVSEDTVSTDDIKASLEQNRRTTENQS